MRSAINLATRPLVNQRGFWLVGSVLALLALIVTTYVAVEGVATWRTRLTTRAQLIELRREQNQLNESLDVLLEGLQDATTQTLLDQNDFLNRVIRQKAFSWATFFEQLAEALPARARILSVTPSLRGDGLVEIKLQVGGESPGAIHEFLRALQQADQFSQVKLHSQELGRSTGDVILAQVSAIYLGAGRP